MKKEVVRSAAKKVTAKKVQGITKAVKTNSVATVPQVVENQEFVEFVIRIPKK